MSDFFDLSKDFGKESPIDPNEIFKEPPKPSGVNDLFTAQSDILKEWMLR